MPSRAYYGIVGNGETCALISPAGSIDWFCAPAFDGTIIFNRALRPDGNALYCEVFDGTVQLMPTHTAQRYVPHTNILETTIEYAGCRVVLTDFMPWKGISETLREKRVLYRILAVTNTTKKAKRIRIRVVTAREGALKPGKVYGAVPFAIAHDPLDLALKPRARAERAITFVYGDSAREVASALSRLTTVDARDELTKAQRFWENWLSRGNGTNNLGAEHARLLERSLLVMKLLIFVPTGAVVAAPTSSFPATPGGTEMWDYRFCWIRDACLVARAFLETGHAEEVRALLSFLYSIQERDGSWLPLYTIHGTKLGKEIVIETATGPARTGNAARTQLQLDGPGSVLHLTYLYYLFTKDRTFLDRYGTRTALAADWIRKNYMKPENGIWELRDREHAPRAQWVYGQALCYAGLASAIRIAEIRKKKPDLRWARTMDRIKAELLRRGWSSQRNAFLQTYAKDAQADISVLALEDYGLLHPTHPRMRSTATLLEERLIVRGFGVKRFEDGALPFYLPTFWLVLHFLRAGERAKAERYLDAALRSTTNLGLMAEHFDPMEDVQHGNFPQAFNHAMLVDVLLAYAERKSSLQILTALTRRTRFVMDIIDEIKPVRELYLEE